MYDPKYWKNTFVQQATAASVYGLAAYLKNRKGSHVEYTGEDPRKETKTMARFRRRVRARTNVRRRRRRFRGRRRLLGKIKRINRRLFRKGIYAVETKYVRLGISQTAPKAVWGSNANVVSLTTPFTQGLELDDVIGGKVWIKKIRFQYLLRAASTATGENYVRVLIVRDKRPDTNGTTPFMQDIIDAYDTSVVSTQSQADYSLFLWQFTHSRQAGRFQVLFNRLHKVSGNEGSGLESVIVKKNIPIFKAWFSNADTGGGQAFNDHRGIGQIYMIVWSNAITDVPTMNLVYRIGYTDV